VDSLDDARALGLLAERAVLPVLPLGHSALSRSEARGLRWPRREVSGYSQKRCLLAHWLFFLRVLFYFISQR
jgi:hypothetical protein